MKKLLKQALFIATGIIMICSTITALADNILRSGERLYSRYSDSLSSNNGQFYLVMQNDGDLTLFCVPNVYGCDANKPFWSTGTGGKNVEFCVMRGDGDLVLYSSNGQIIWHSGTGGNYKAHLTLQDNGNMTIFAYAYKDIWATNTEIVNGVRPIIKRKLP